MKKPAAIIFDRDGTLNATSTTQGGYVTAPDQVKLLPDVKQTCEALHTQGIKLFVFTQQSCIGKGVITEDNLTNINNQLQLLLGEDIPITGFYHCPHIEEDNCTCRKPKPGMIQQILSDHNLSVDDVLVIGDAWRDYESALAVKCKYYFVPSDVPTKLDDVKKRLSVSGKEHLLLSDGISGISAHFSS